MVKNWFSYGRFTAKSGSLSMVPDDRQDDQTQSFIPLTRGATVSHYRIIEKIGAGGMGEVYLAEDTKLDRKVALKFLPSHLCQDEDCRARFKREAQAVAKLDHPNIVTIHEVSEYQGRPFFAMQLVEGQSLRELSKGKELSVDRIIELAIQISDGLGAAHEKKVVHRDIKPSNIVIDAYGRPKILDFGLAAIQGGEHLTKTGSTLGTVRYMSPEQVQGQEVDHQSDLFSLGIVLYELVAGRTPFERDNEAATLKAITLDNPEPLARYKSDIPDELQRTVSKLLEKDPSMRYQSAAGLISDLKTLARDQLSVSKKEVSPPSIAVLPFTNLSADPEQEYFCDGMAEEIINGLTHVEGMRVVARTSCFAFKAKSEDIREIGRKLSVESLLEGSVRKAGNRLRITAQLINVADGYHLWSEKYDRDIEDVFAIQDEISLAIVDKLKVKLLRSEEKKIVKRHTADLDAYNLYLRGRHFWNKRMPDELDKAIEHFQRAIDRDPSYALAYAGLADCYNMLGFFTYRPPKDMFLQAKAAANKALELDQDLAEAVTSLAHVHTYYDRDWPAAEAGYQRAIALNPGYATAHQWYGEFLMLMGRFEEAIAAGRHAVELDPLSEIIATNLAGIYVMARQYEQASEYYHKTIELDPYYVPAYVFLGYLLQGMGDYDQALAVTQKAQSLVGKDFPKLTMRIAAIKAMAGKPDEAQRVLQILDELSQQGYISPWDIAELHFALGQYDQTFEWFERAEKERLPWMVFFKVSPMLDPLRSDPRFTALMKKIGFSE